MPTPAHLPAQLLSRCLLRGLVGASPPLSREPHVPEEGLAPPDRRPLGRAVRPGMLGAQPPDTLTQDQDPGVQGVSCRVRPTELCLPET